MDTANLELQRRATSERECCPDNTPIRSALNLSPTFTLLADHPGKASWKSAMKKLLLATLLLTLMATMALAEQVKIFAEATTKPDGKNQARLNVYFLNASAKPIRYEIPPSF